MRSIKSWGNNFQKNVKIVNTINAKKHLLTFGNNNSYGDASIPHGEYQFEPKIESSDDKFVNPKLTISEYMSTYKNTLTSIPGKSDVTLGGAVASDVHGKDSFYNGSFIKNIKALKVFTSEGKLIECDRESNSDLFYATVGGYGLTGTIIGIELFQNDYLNNLLFDTEVFTGMEINNLLNQFSKIESGFSVAWIDTLSKKLNWVLEVSSPTGIKSKRNKSLNKKQFQKIKSIVSFSLIGKNKFGLMSLINKIYFFLKRKKKNYFKNFEEVFYPLSFFTDTRLISKKQKIIQVQFSIPEKNQNAIPELISLLTKNQKPLLCSLKRLGNNESSSNLSFVQKGWSIAIDFPYYEFDKIEIRKFVKFLIHNDGKIYLAKDSIITDYEFQQMYRNHTTWMKITKKYDPDGIFQSSLSKRLKIK